MDMTTLVKDNKMVVYLSEEIDHHSARAIRDGIDKLIFNHRPKVLVIDLEGVDFMDSSGLGLVLGRYKRIKEIGGEIYIANADERTRKILKMAGVDKLIKIIECTCNNNDYSERKD